MHYFDYEIGPEIGMAGTYFYHSHVGLQALSAAGPLIVKDAKKPPYQYDEERTLIFSDYFNKTDDSMAKGLVANPFKWTGEVNQVLLNGYGMPNGSTSDKANAATKCSLMHLSLQPGKTYRLRFIGGTGLSFLSLAIQDHSGLKLIEADGQYTQPHAVDYIQLGSGQRYSFLLKAKSVSELVADQARGKNGYYMQYKTLERPTTAISYAVIDYPGFTKSLKVPPPEAPLSLPPTTNGWLDYELAPLADNAYPPASAVTRTVTLKIRQQWQNASASQVVWIMQDNTTWTETYRALPPYLVSVYENATAQLPDYDYALTKGGFDDRVRAFPARIGEVLDIVLQTEGTLAPAGQDVHPFHMHGKHFWDLGSGNGTYDAAANEAKWAGKTPVLRDSTMLFRPWKTAPVGAGAGWRAWRLNVTQPGAWMLHCHTLQVRSSLLRHLSLSLANGISCSICSWACKAYGSSATATRSARSARPRWTGISSTAAARSATSRTMRR